MSSRSKRSPGNSIAVPAVVAAAAVALLSGCSSSASSPAASGSTGGTGTPAAVTTSIPVSSTGTAVAAAGVATTAATASGEFDSCSVVTQAEAASAIGETVSAGVLGTATVEGGLACVFYGASAPAQRDPNVAQPDTVRVVVVEGADATTWYQDYQTSPAVHARQVGGYADKAYYDGYASFSVLKGDVYVRISISPAGAAPSLAHEEKLMTAVLPGV